MGALVTITGVLIIGGPEHHRRGMPPAMRGGLRRVITYWHRKYLRQHFRKGARQRYGYKPRSRRYEERKFRAKGHRAPLTWSGLTRRMVQLPIPVMATAKSGRGVMQVPWYVRMVPRKRNAPSLGKELIITRTDEARDMQDVLHDDVLEQLLANRERTYRKI